MWSSQVFPHNEATNFVRSYVSFFIRKKEVPKIEVFVFMILRDVCISDVMISPASDDV